MIRAVAPRPHGIVPPLVLPMAADGSLDERSLRRHARALMDAGVHGLWANGTTGEFHALDAAQRVKAVEVVAETSNAAVPVVAHVGDTGATRAIAHAKAAIAAGADLVSVIAPYYADLTQDELCEHYRQVADSIGGPILAYHFPQLSKNALTIESLHRLAAEGVVIGVKDSGGDMGWFRTLTRAAAGADLACFTGGGKVIDLGLFLGAAGAMPSIANLVPRHLVRMYRAAVRDEWPEVRAMQDQLEDLINAIRIPTRTTLSAQAGVYKYILTELGNIEAEHAAAPVRPLDAAERGRLAATVLPLIAKLERRSDS